VIPSTIIDASNHCGCGGGRIGFAKLERNDRAAILEVFEGLSERSRRRRFHGPKPRLSAPELDALADVGGGGREAVAAVDVVSGKTVGIARFVRDAAESNSAEVAFAVVDRCQGSGIGRTLLERLKALAAQDGVDRFRAFVTPGNEAALALLRGVGSVARSSYQDGAYELEIDLSGLRA
jgi:ribosomal protein S18 acetylase RimI-like enzyme